jgi:hypothetical protein
MSKIIDGRFLELYEQHIDNQHLMVEPRKYNKKKYTKEEIIEIAKTCNNKGEFIKNYYKIYLYLGKTDFKKEIMSLIPRKIKWTPELLVEEAKKYKTRSQWLKNHASSYNISIKMPEIFAKCVEHMTYHGRFGDTKTLRKYTYEDVVEIYSKYTRIKDLFDNDRKIYNAAIRNGWHKELSKDMERYVTENSIWTFDKVKDEALKYNSIKEFKEGNRNAYFKAVYSKWLLEIIGHMTGGNTKWTLEKLVGVLKKHESSRWYKIPECKAPLAYIKRHKIEDKVLDELKNLK